jgi:hypothetical protein
MECREPALSLQTGPTLEKGGRVADKGATTRTVLIQETIILHTGALNSRHGYNKLPRLKATQGPHHSHFQDKCHRCILNKTQGILLYLGWC